MRMPKRLGLLGAMCAFIVVAAGACSAAPAPAALTPLKFQLKWVTQAQFAGYYAALDQGYYKDAGLDVTLLIGGPNINEVQVVASGSADMGTTWLPSMLQAREHGADLVSISQIFQRSGTRMASFKTANITKPADLKGKKIGSWLGGNEPELFAALTKAGRDPTKENVIKQNFNMDGLLGGDLDAAQAMIYNEYAQVLEAKNKATGKLYTPDDFNIIDFNDPSVGTAMMQDQVFASAKWLATGSNAQIATKFLTATYRGWIYCRDNAQKCVDIVLAKGSQLRRQPSGVADERDQRARSGRRPTASASSTRRPMTRRSRSRRRTRCSCQRPDRRRDAVRSRDRGLRRPARGRRMARVRATPSRRSRSNKGGN